jgi:hypothetical protein
MSSKLRSLRFLRTIECDVAIISACLILLPAFVDHYYTKRAQFYLTPSWISSIRLIPTPKGGDNGKVGIDHQIWQRYNGDECETSPESGCLGTELHAVETRKQQRTPESS